MGFKSLIFSLTIGVVILAYFLHDPYLPDGFEDTIPNFVCGRWRFAHLMGQIGGLMGFERNTITTKTLELAGSLRLKEFSIDGITYTDTLFGDSVPVRVYTPDRPSKDKALPGVVYYHGGGWAVGNTKTYHPITMTIAKQLQSVVVSVDYRRAPQHPYPAPVDDCFEATKYFMTHAQDYGVDPKRIAVMGDSAGGNLATVISMKLRDAKFEPMPKLQVLFYPVLQLLAMDTPSYQYNQHGPFLTMDLMGYFASVYLFGSDEHARLIQENGHVIPEVKQKLAQGELNIKSLPDDDMKKNFNPAKPLSVNATFWQHHSSKFTNPYVCPILAQNVKNLPPAYISSCQYDVLRDDAFFYANKLKSAGVKVEHVNVKVCHHSWLFDSLHSEQLGQEAEKVYKWLRSNL